MSCTTFIIKCTRKCNLSCTYCGDRRQDGELDFENFAILLKEIGTHFKDRNIEFVYHGGEPLTMGVDYFLKLMCMQRLCGINPDRIKNTIQTNGTLINDEWCDFFREYGFQIGVSLDGPEEIQDMNRRYANGRSSFKDVMRGLKLLQEKGVRFGVLSVVSDALLECETSRLFRFFIDNSVENFCLLPLRPVGDSFHGIEEARDFYRRRKRYAAMLCEMYTLWVNENNPGIRIRELVSKLDALVGGRASVCSEGGNCIGKYFGIDSNGNIAHCDKFFNNRDMVYGNLKKTTLHEILASERFCQSAAMEEKIRGQCRSCEWFGICKGGCLYEAVLFGNSGLEDREAFCHLKIIYEFISEKLHQQLKCG